MSSSWRSFPLQVLYVTLGWIAFTSWSISFYPQIFLNYQRKSVVGLHFDFALLNFLKQMVYFVYNASLFFSPTVQKQYRAKFGQDEMIPVAVNDVAFSIHAVLMSGFTGFQIFIYYSGNQKLSRACIVFVTGLFLFVLVCTCIAIPKHSWYWVISCFSTMQVVMTIVKYMPQMVFNFQRKSTIGFSIGNILLDFFGGICNIFQMIVQSIDQHSMKNLYGNIGKTLLALFSILFCAIFIIQHYVLYPAKKADESQQTGNVELPRDIEAR